MKLWANDECDGGNDDKEKKSRKRAKWYLIIKKGNYLLKSCSQVNI